jgi:hypothetical protein
LKKWHNYQIEKFFKMTYEEDLIKKIHNTEGYLWWKESSILSELNGAAEDFCISANPEGKIASLFIYHQLMIEQLKLLIRYINFFIQLSLYPIKIQNKDFQNESQFAAIREYFKYTIEFKGKANILRLASEINRLRNEYGHGLKNKWIYTDCEKELINLQTDYEAFFHAWGQGLNEIRTIIETAKKRDEIAKLKNNKRATTMAHKA